MMKTLKLTLTLSAAAALLLTACDQQPVGPQLTYTRQGDTLTIVNITNASRYLLLPIQEDKDDRWVKINTGNEETDTWMDIRLAQDSADYYVPFALPAGEDVRVDIKYLPMDAKALDLLQLSDTFDTTNREYYRPAYHMTPDYGWMNDPNGMTYLNGEYHLFFQYNPYGSKWGNMHWGHVVSPDMIHWKQLDPAIARDNYGQIFSGSSIVARIPEGAGTDDPFLAETLVPGNGGEGDFIASYYTSDNWRMPREMQEMQSYAVSMDGGRTYRKYGAPVLKSDGRRDFRDPKLFWYEPKQQWYMIVSADNEMQFYASKNLRDWTYVSAFGDGYGVQPRQFECPDFFPLNVDGDPKKQKWVMIVNVNPGCWFGGSASQYFVGDFDGEKFVCDSPKEIVKWLDWGKDHYAAVTFANEPKGRIIAICWMSNWQYANDLPTRQYRSQMGMPRELFAYSVKGSKEIYVGQKPVEELQSILKPASISVEANTVNFGNTNAQIMVELDVKNGTTFSLANDEGEEVFFSVNAGRVLMDRQKSGIIPTQDFVSETWSPKPQLGTNIGTWAPVEQLCGKQNTYHLQLWMDISSIEMYVEGGRATMTNLVFPKTPYNKISGEGISNVKVSNIAL